MQIQSFFEPKTLSETFLTYDGASKDSITGSVKSNMKQAEPEEYPMGEWGPSEPEEYPMGEWNPSSNSGSAAETVLSAIGQGTICDTNCSPNSDELVTSLFSKKSE